MMNGGADHTLCAFSLWEAQVRCKQLELEVSALRQEIERLRTPAPQPDPTKEGEHA